MLPDYPYTERPIRFLELFEQNGWRLKVYGIRLPKPGAPDKPDSAVVEHAKSTAAAALDQPAVNEHRYGVGFLIIHQGQDRNWILLDWWFDREILKQKLFSSPLDEPNKVTAVQGDLLACTWELAVHAFEREAWISNILRRPENPDMAGYLGARLNADV